MSIASIRRGLVLTGKSIAFIARNGPKPDGSLRVCRAVVEVPDKQFDLYRSLVQMETDRLEMPTRAEVILNLIEVADPGYREFQVTLRVS